MYMKLGLGQVSGLWSYPHFMCVLEGFHCIPQPYMQYMLVVLSAV